MKLIDASEVIVSGNVTKSGAVTVKSRDSGTKDNEDSSNIVGRKIRTIKLKQDIYYGPKNTNKNKFMRMYKKLGLIWRTETIGGVVVDGWISKDKSQYIIKLPEEGDYKRFKFYGCDEIYNYFISLGAVTFDLSENKDNISGINIQKKDGIVDTKDEKYEFIGADLWSGHMTRRLLKNIPDNWGVIWK